MNNKKIAVVLLNLGGPDSQEAVKPFLFNLFYDKAIISLPNPFRWLIAKLISLLREKKAKTIYAFLGGSSPILKNTEAQARALKEKLGDRYEIFICMRYWHPMSRIVARQIKEYNPDNIIFLPLYPQYSKTTTGSSLEAIKNALKKENVQAQQKVICCYPTSDGFIKAHADLIVQEIKKVKDPKNAILLFSAHGLPQKIIDEGDPYQYQVEKAVEAVVSSLNLGSIEHKITYQSRVGPMKWIGPSTEEEIKTAAKAKKTIIITPIAFVSEHVETLVELDIEYKEIAKNFDVDYFRVPALSIKDTFIDDLASIVKTKNLPPQICNQLQCCGRIS